MTRFALLAGLLALLTACGPSAADAPISEQWRNIELTTAPIEFGAETVGRLRFRGGLQLSAPNHHAFGGLSGLEVLDDGRILAVSDYGEWFEARLVLDEAGVLVGLSEPRGALMRDENGEPFESKAAGDSEDLTQLPDGRIAVSFEQTQTIRIYDINRDGPFGAAQTGPILDGAERLRDNVGLEAITATLDGVLLVGAEGGGRRGAPVWLAPIQGAMHTSARFAYPTRPGFSLTGLDRLPDGGFVAVERFYAPVIGARARITRIPAVALEAEGGVLRGLEQLAELAAPMPVDNFEGIAAARGPNGGTRIYIVSDDNFSDRQRTLLLAFDLIEQESAD